MKISAKLLPQMHARRVESRTRTQRARVRIANAAGLPLGRLAAAATRTNHAQIAARTWRRLDRPAAAALGFGIRRQWSGGFGVKGRQMPTRYA